MARGAVVALLIVVVALVFYLFGGGGDRTPAPRRSAEDPGLVGMQWRIDELERRVHALETREATPAENAERPAGATPATRAAEPAAPGETPEQRQRRFEKHRDEWEQRFFEAQTTPQRLAVLRDGHSQLKRHADGATLKAFFDRLLERVDPASDEGMEIMIELGHLARAAKDYRTSDEYYLRVESLAKPESRMHAWANFQLAWNRRFEKDMAGAEDRFRRAANAEEVNPGTKAAAHYALGQIYSEAGDFDRAREEWATLVRYAKQNPQHGGVRHYRMLARDALASLDDVD